MGFAWRIAVAWGVSIAWAVPTWAAEATAHEDRCVILISIDGLAGFYFDDPRAELPTLRRLAREGALSTRMRCSFPTVTWPNHTTLVTGVPPAVHGVLGNNVIERPRGEMVKLIGDSRFDKVDLVRAPTIYDAAHAAGLKTAAISWPATRNAPTLDWTLPDVYSQELFDRYATPGWLDELRSAGVPVDMRGTWVDADDTMARCDWLSTRAATHVLENHRPSLVLLHLLVSDSVQHKYGPRSPEAYWALAYADRLVRDVLDAVERSGRSGTTSVLIVSDHGFFSIDKVIQPNVALQQAGLLEARGKEVLHKDVYVWSQGGAAPVYIMDRTKAPDLIPRLKEIFGRIEGIERVIDQDEFAALGQPTPREHPWGADLWLAAEDGYVFWHGVETDEIVADRMPAGAPTYQGMHGYLPDHRNMRGVFLAQGRGVRTGVTLDEVTNLQVAPTAAQLLGVELPSAEGKAIGEALE